VALFLPRNAGSQKRFAKIVFFSRGSVGYWKTPISEAGFLPARQVLALLNLGSRKIDFIYSFQTFTQLSLIGGLSTGLG